MRYLLLSVLVVCVIGIMIPSAFGLFHSSPIGESIIKEKECEMIGKEIDPNIECRLVLKNWDEMPVLREGTFPSPMAYDSDNDLMYFGAQGYGWKANYFTVEMDNFTIVDVVKCDGVTTGTYTKTTTYPCELQDIPDQKGGWYWKGSGGDSTDKWLTQSQTTTPYQYKFEDNGASLQVFSGEKIISSCWEKTGATSVLTFDCIFEDDKEIPVQPIHTYKTDLNADVTKVFSK